MKPLYLLAATLLTTRALAQTSLDYAKMSRKVWSLFECTVLVGYTDNETEAERLFLLGYETGTTFVEALRAGKIKREDLRNHIPWTMGEKLSGPKAEFAVGRLFESIQGYTVKEIWEDTGSNEDLRKSKALSTYEKQNCSFLK
jgi:hypothetical protein